MQAPIKTQDGDEARFKTYPKGHMYLDLPDADSYLINCLNMLDVCKSGESLTPLNWTDIKNFCEQSGFDLNGWQSEQVINMSRAFCFFYHKAKDTNCPPPYFNKSGLIKNREIVAKQLAESRIKKQP